MVTMTRGRLKEAKRLLEAKKTTREIQSLLRMSSRTVTRIRRGEVCKFADDKPCTCKSCGRPLRVK